jgi:hypothetical protein
MKYFTSEWWGSGCEGADDVFAKYQQYIQSVKHRLPKAAVTLDAHHTLHDSEVKEITSDFTSKETRLSLLGWNTGFNTKTKYHLTFTGVSLFEQHLPPDEYVESELGDIGYWEWEALSEGTELRMLFASSAVFRLVFKDFEFTHESVQA